MSASPPVQNQIDVCAAHPLFCVLHPLRRMPKPRAPTTASARVRSSATAAAGVRATRRTSARRVPSEPAVLSEKEEAETEAPKAGRKRRTAEPLPDVIAHEPSSSASEPASHGEGIAKTPQLTAQPSTNTTELRRGTASAKRTPHVVGSRIVESTKEALSTSSVFSAARLGDLDAVRRHVDAGVDPSAKSPELGRSALHHAAEGGSSVVVSYLLQIPSVDINAQAKDGSTALHSAAAGDSAAVIGMLLADSRVLPNATAKDGLTAYALAKKLGRPAAAAKLSANPRVKRGSSFVSAVHTY